MEATLPFPTWLIVGAAVAQSSGAAPDPSQEIVITAYPPHCHPRPDDAQDAVDLAPAAAHGEQQTIRLDASTGAYALVPDDYPSADPVQWQRAGTRMDQYVFRVPVDDNPVCIGARARPPAGFAQLRRAFAAKPLWGKVLRFTAFVATRQAANVRLWVAGGAGSPQPGKTIEPGTNIVVGGGQWPPMAGNRGWTPVSLTIGPVPCMATQISYGVTLKGRGDVWLYKPRLEEVPESEMSPAVRARQRGAEYLAADPICRHFIHGEPLYVQVRSKDKVLWTKITDDNRIVPGIILFEKGAPNEVGADMVHAKPGQTFVQVPYENYIIKGLNL
jgi:hypothetical protein